MIFESNLNALCKKDKVGIERLQDVFLNTLLSQYLVGADYLQYTSKEKIKRFKKLLNQWNLIHDSSMISSKKSKTAGSEDGVNAIMQTLPVEQFIGELHDF